MSNLGLKTIIIIIFMSVFLLSVLFINNYYSKKQNEISQIFNQFQKENSVFSAPHVQQVNRIVAELKLSQIESKIYSSLILFFLFSSACLIFIFLVNQLTKPLHDLTKASEQIKTGNYKFSLPPYGLKDIKNLIRSFNEMAEELEKTQNKLLVSQKNEIWKEIAGILTHEIKNPLTPILLTMQRLEEKYWEDTTKMQEIFPESLQLIYQEVNNLQYLVDSFQSFAKEIVPQPIVFDVAQAIYDIIKPYTTKYSITFSPVGEYRIFFDRSHFYQIFTNLFHNALESTSGNPKIIISLGRCRSLVALRIKDEGVGIAAEDLSRIFVPYFTKKSKGTGLGLALVKKLIDANQSHIKVESVINQGTIVEIDFAAETIEKSLFCPQTKGALQDEFHPEVKR